MIKKEKDIKSEDGEGVMTLWFKKKKKKWLYLF